MAANPVPDSLEVLGSCIAGSSGGASGQRHADQAGDGQRATTPPHLMRMRLGQSGSLVDTWLIDYAGRAIGNGPIPAAAVGTALGTGGGVAVTLAANASDIAGTITLTAGSASLTTGVAATITFANPWLVLPKAIVLYPANASAAINASQAFVPAATTTTWTINYNTAPTSGLSYVFNYEVLG